jgi:hypothetical protein
MRIALLFGINLLIQMKEPWFYIELSWFRFGIVNFTGEVVLIYKKLPMKLGKSG